MAPLREGTKVRAADGAPLDVLLRLRDGSCGGRPVAVAVRGQATVGELIAALGWPDAEVVVVDGRPVRVDAALDHAAVVQGSTIAPVPPSGADASSRRVVTTICDGLDAGRTVLLAPGAHLVGRSPAAAVVVPDPSAALLDTVLHVPPARGAAVWVGAVDRAVVGESPGQSCGPGVSHGPGVPCGAGVPGGDGPLPPGSRWRCGSTTLALDEGDVVGAAVPPVPTARATVTAHRPPRPRPAAPVRLAVPVAPAAPLRRPLALAAVLLPLALAAALVAVTGSWLFALMTVLSPLVAVSAWWSGRQQARRAGRAVQRRLRTELDGFAAALSAARVAHDAGRAARAVDVAALASSIASGRSLWARRLDDGDALRLTIGHAPQGWQPLLEREPDRDAPAAVHRLLAEAGAALDAPVELDLAAAGAVGVVGDPEAARRVARSLVLQVLAHHGPADIAVEVALEPGRRDGWSFLGWVPHLEAVGRAGCTLLVVDDDEVAGRAGAAVRAALRGERGPTVGVVVASGADRLPAACSVLVDVDALGAATVTDLRGGAVTGLRARPHPPTVAATVAATLTGVRAMGVAADVATGLAAGLARYEDPDLSAPQGELPATVGMLDLLGRRRPGGDLGAVDELGGAWDLGGAGDLGAVGELGAAGDPGGGGALVAWADGAPADGGRHDGRATLAVPIGVGADGPVVVDLVADGPHALVAGTTGAGKSELLRSWVAAMAARYPPACWHAVLVDFKGGSAFDACAELPHTVAVVTDLDDELAERLLRSLQAELTRRERLLRRAGVADIADLAPGMDGRPAVARLVVAIDEFATLRAELPEFLDALVGVAQRGRSLGVHLILATQRPAGVVSEHIRANTNIRIALRVQDGADSRDVIDRPDAAAIDRRRPGRALVRLGRDEVLAVQTSFSGARSTTAGPAVRRVSVEGLDPLVGRAAFEQQASAAEGPARAGRTDLERVVAAARAAADAAGVARPTAPWTPPLPDRVGLDALGRPPAFGTGALPFVPFVLLDDPDHQRRLVGGWEPASGNLLCFGATGSGVSTALASLVCAVAAARPADAVHVHVIGDDPALRALAGLPHVGNVVSLGDDERLARLLALLESGAAARRNGAATPPVLLVVDGLAALLATDQPGSSADQAVERWTRLLTDGATLGVHTVAAATHPAAVRHAVAATVAQRLVFRLADPLDARQLGVAAVGGPPGRVRAIPGGLLGQVALPMPSSRPGSTPGGPGTATAADPTGAAASTGEASTGEASASAVALVTAAVARLAAAGPRPAGAAPTVRRLPGSIAAAALRPAHVAEDDAVLCVPIGVGGVPGAEAVLRLRRGDGVLVAGPARSGRSTALAMLAAAIGDALGPDASVVLIGGARSPSGPPPSAERLSAALAVPATAPRWGVVLVDDADTVEDPGGILVRAQAAGWVVVAAGRNDALRAAYGHWTRSVRASRLGVLLRPDLDLDGELLGIRPGRRHESPLDRSGRGLLVQDGTVSVVQLAMR